MELLLFYLAIMYACYLISYKLIKDKSKFALVGPITSFLVYLLVFTMGTRMGANEEVTSAIGTIGLQAVIITAMTLAGTILAAMVMRKILGLNRYGHKIRTADGNAADGKNTAQNGPAAGEGGHGNALKSSMIIVGVVALGMAAGYLFVPRLFAEIDQFQELSGLLLNVFLCLLLAFVGFDLGFGGSIVDKFKDIGLKALLMPIAVIIGTLAMSAVFSIFSPLSLKESLAIGAGFGWYSLAPSVIMEAGFATASAVAFLHNVMREMVSILLLPIIADKVGYFEATAMPGAPGMDVCLPMVERSTNGDMAIYSLVSGLVLSLLVPVLVPLIVG